MTQDENQAAASGAAVPVAEGKRVAVYDLTLLRFVTGAVSPAQAKAYIKSGAAGHEYEIRAV